MSGHAQKVARDRCSMDARERCSMDARDRALAGLSN